MKFVNSGDNPKNFHFKLDFLLGFSFSFQLLPPDLPLYLEQHGGGRETVGTHRMAVGILGAEVQLEPFSRVGIYLHYQERKHFSTSNLSLQKNPLNFPLNHAPCPINLQTKTLSLSSLSDHHLLSTGHQARASLYTPENHRFSHSYLRHCPPITVYLIPLPEPYSNPNTYLTGSPTASAELDHPPLLSTLDPLPRAPFIYDKYLHHPPPPTSEVNISLYPSPSASLG